MIRAIIFIFIFFISSGLGLLPVQAATPILFKWSYSAENEAQISSYRIYRDGIGSNFRILEPSKELREVQYQEEDDKKPHVYFISAYRFEGDVESPGSVFAWFKPAESDPPTTPGTMIIEIPPITATIKTQ